MEVSARVAFPLVFSLILINAAKAQQPVDIESDAGVVTTVATVEAIDATRQVVTLVGPTITGSWSRSAPAP